MQTTSIDDASSGKALAGACKNRPDWPRKSKFRRIVPAYPAQDWTRSLARLAGVLKPIGAEPVAEAEQLFAGVTFELEHLRKPIALAGVTLLLDLLEPRERIGLGGEIARRRTERFPHELPISDVKWFDGLGGDGFASGPEA